MRVFRTLLRLLISYALHLFQRYGKQHVLIRLDLDDLGLRQDMIARTNPTPKRRRPVLHIPLETPGRYNRRLAHRDDAHVLRKQVARDAADGPGDLEHRLPYPDLVPPAAFEHEGQRVARHQVQPAVSVRGRLLEQVQVVHLAEPLVHAPAESAHAHDGAPRRRLAPREEHGLGEVGAVLVRVADDARAREVVVRRGREGV